MNALGQPGFHHHHAHTVVRVVKKVAQGIQLTKGVKGAGDEVDGCTGLAVFHATDGLGGHAKVLGQHLLCPLAPAAGLGNVVAQVLQGAFDGGIGV